MFFTHFFLNSSTFYKQKHHSFSAAVLLSTSRSRQIVWNVKKEVRFPYGDSARTIFAQYLYFGDNPQPLEIPSLMKEQVSVYH